MTANLDQTLAQVSPEVLLDLMQQLMQEALVRTRRGETIEVTPIERGIAVMCEKIAAMPGREGDAFRDGLTGLMKQLDGLAQALGEQKDSVAQEIQQVNLHRKANTAYRSATHQYGAKPEKEDEEE